MDKPRTAWLDGLRGLAAAIVAFNHFFMGGIFDFAFHSYWADPPSANRHFIQLPPVRLLFSAHAMVALFFVISGYALSINLLRLRDTPFSSLTASASAHNQTLLRGLASATTRRIFRIYLPVFLVAILSQLLFFCGLYHWSFGDDVVWGRRPWTAPTFHFTYLLRYLLDIVNIIQFHHNPGLNGQLWTMPIEFRGSLMVYLVILAMAFWRREMRVVGVAGLALYFLWYGIWDGVGFLGGLGVAELAQGLGAAEVVLGRKEGEYGLSTASARLRQKLRTLVTVLCFVMGLHLLCLGDDGVLTPGYQWLVALQSPRWDDDWAIVSKSWKTVGSLLVVYAIDRVEVLQRVLERPTPQFLGKISFSLYLVHQSVYHVARDPVRNGLWWIMTGQQYPATDEEAIALGIGAFVVSLGVTAVVMGVLVVWLSSWWTRVVDARCVRLSRRIDEWLSR
ncbi:acyltransferase family protein [Aspergillus homomorphus CBS 101889]|uniref:Acyltransferase 3 domain-containing protein n=1 Tax=Aspergillus homomorphus (strain CBS 101889) TaxID=1450537 RepID=A0A395HY58_ASPHC|nr:hypothetical protein BO97DRAFT_390063 [Aspergillus homomorphus CBS 101889]RAL12439.1 hypothetical protein BO97DRAFT_390063 [Aspergillus homomorphus CBS 101889]